MDASGDEMSICFCLSNNTDPEERLEEAALWKALHDEFGDEISLVDSPSQANGRLFIGRGKKTDVLHSIWRGDDGPHDYWNDPEFLKRANRSFKLCDWDYASKEVDRLHNCGKDAFVKATEQKLMTSRVMIGRSLGETLGDFVYSFLDRPPCLLVQELKKFTAERRFIVINRKIVSHSPNAVHLTPIDNGLRDFHFETPLHKVPFKDVALSEAMVSFAEDAANNLRQNSVCLDLALIDGKIGIVETNPMHLGQLGLFAQDVRAIAKAMRDIPQTRKSDVPMWNRMPSTGRTTTQRSMKGR